MALIRKSLINVYLFKGCLDICLANNLIKPSSFEVLEFLAWLKNGFIVHEWLNLL